MLLPWPDQLAVPSAGLQCRGNMARLPISASRARDEAEDKKGDT